MKCITWALEQPIAGNEKVVLFVLGNRARDEDGTCFPGQEEVARQAYISAKTVGRIEEKLETAGYLSRTPRFKANGDRTSDLIRLLVPWAPSAETGPTDNVSAGGRKGGAPTDTGVSDQQTRVSVESTGNRQSLSLTGEGTRAKPVSYRGKRVDAAVVGRAEGALAVFNEMTGRTLSTRTGDGSASAMLKQVIGTMLEWPDVTAEQWATAVRNTCENPPDWVDGKQLQVGHIFGARAVQHALANTGCPSARSRIASGQSVVERTQSKAERWARGEV